MTKLQKEKFAKGDKIAHENKISLRQFCTKGQLCLSDKFVPPEICLLLQNLIPTYLKYLNLFFLLYINRNFGIRSAFILRIWPSQRSLRWLRLKYIVVRQVRLNTSSLVIFCCHVIPRMRRRHRRWKVLIFFSCTLDNVHVSLP